MMILGVRPSDSAYVPVSIDDDGNLSTRAAESATDADGNVVAAGEVIDGRLTAFVRDRYSARLLEEILLTLIQIRDHLRETR